MCDFGDALHPARRVTAGGAPRGAPCRHGIQAARLRAPYPRRRDLANDTESRAPPRSVPHPARRHRARWRAALMAEQCGTRAPRDGNTNYEKRRRETTGGGGGAESQREGAGAGEASPHAAHQQNGDAAPDEPSTSADAAHRGQRHQRRAAGAHRTRGTGAPGADDGAQAGQRSRQAALATRHRQPGQAGARQRGGQTAHPTHHGDQTARASRPAGGRPGHRARHRPGPGRAPRAGAQRD